MAKQLKMHTREKIISPMNGANQPGWLNVEESKQTHVYPRHTTSLQVRPRTLDLVEEIVNSLTQQRTF